MIKSLIFYTRILSLALVINFLTGCHFTTTSIEIPKFNLPADSLGSEINLLVTCEHTTAAGKEIKTNGKLSSEIDIEIINASGLPSNDNDLKALGRKIAVVFKRALADPGKYDHFSVFFTTQKSKAGVSVKNRKEFDFMGKEI